MRRSLLAGLLCLALAAGLVAACGGSDPPPIRIGVLLDCGPPLGGHFEEEVAAVEAPLLARGADPAGPLPSDGVRGARIGGRPVEVVAGCSQLERYHQVVDEA